MERPRVARLAKSDYRSGTARPNDAVNAMLLNEFLKEHRKNEEQEATIAQLKRDSAEQRKQIETLTAGLQKVSDQFELSQSAPRTVVSDQ